MESRSIGGIKVSPLGLGTARMASLGARRSRSDAARLLDAAADLGVNFIDTADTYGSTACERWLGDVLPTRSHRFVIATKSGLATADLPGPLRPLNQPVKKIMQRTGRVHQLEPAHVRRSIDASLRRLRRDRIDIYLLHSPPSGVERSDELFDVLDRAHLAGKIGLYGVSSADPDVVAAVTRVRGCAIAQTTVNPLAAGEIVELLPADGNGAKPVELIGSHVLMAPLLLSGSIPKGSSPAVVDLRRRLESLSAERGLTKSQLLIRHAAAVPSVRVVLTGTSSPTHLAENVAALGMPLQPEDLLA